MHTADSAEAGPEAAPEPSTGTIEAEFVTQQDEGLEDELERLVDENEDLKVWHH